MPTSFFSRIPAAKVWRTITGVSPAGAKRGRGKGTDRAQVIDFNRGQEIGVGRKMLTLPGMNVSSMKYRTVEDQGPNPEFNEKLLQVRGRQNTFRKYRDHPLERGWSGRKAHGRRAGPPDPYNETEFPGFDSTVLMLRPLMSMRGNIGRFRRNHGLVVTGNKNGLAGFATAVGTDPRAVVRKARNSAAQALMSVPIWNNHTVMHDFFSRYYYTTVFVQRKPPGYGIRAHRIIKAICEAFGIKDLRAEVRGSISNQINITKAFFLGLANQRKYQDMADDKELHLVEMREENFNLPQILATPKTRVRTDDEIKINRENIDFTYYIYDGRIKSVKPPRINKWIDHPKYHKYLDRQDYVKNREATKLLLAAKYEGKKVLDVFPHFRSTATCFYKPDSGPVFDNMK